MKASLIHKVVGETLTVEIHWEDRVVLLYAQGDKLSLVNPTGEFAIQVPESGKFRIQLKLED